MGPPPADMPPGTLIQIVDDDQSLVSLYHDFLTSEGFVVQSFTNPLLGLEAARHSPYRLILLDLTMPGMDGITYLDRIRREPRPPEVIIVTARADMTLAVDALRRGAFEYLVKPVRLEKLLATVRSALAKAQTTATPDRVSPGQTGASAGSGSPGSPASQLVAQCREMVQIVDRVAYVASYFHALLIWGPPGTGKSAFAQAIHAVSDRGRKPLHRLDVSEEPLPEGLRMKLFGDPSSRKPGLIHSADGGIVWIRDIDRLPFGVQGMLHGFLETGETPGDPTLDLGTSDVKVIATTASDLRKEVERGKFHEDLYYRLRRIEFKLPALRERPQDIAPLAQHFLEEQARLTGKHLVGITEKAEQVLRRWPWEGNVAELKSVIVEACTHCRDGRIDIAHLPPRLR